MAAELNPFELRDQLQNRCPDCGLPRNQQFVAASHRGTFQHGSAKLKVRPVGQTCECTEKLGEEDKHHGG